MDPLRFFGYFERGEARDPTRFIQARWQIMEQELGLNEARPLGELIIRRVADLRMWVRLPQGSFTPPAGFISGLQQGESGDDVQVERARTYPIALVQMPQPEFMTHAYFVGLALVPTTGVQQGQPNPQARVFTLEKIEGEPTDGRLCEWLREQQGSQCKIIHRNYGNQVPATREAFVRAVTERIAGNAITT